jgi:hypothetical protein
MLVQSTPDLIELLPAVPKAWPSGKALGFRACSLNGEIKVIKTRK